MRIFFSIVAHEMKLLWRDRTFQVLSVLLLLLTLYTVFNSTEHFQHARDNQEQLADTARHMLVNQKPTSAHMAGHYGHVVFKPATYLQAVDPGVNLFTGTTIRMEAHLQHEAVFSAASGQSSLVRFGTFSFSLLLQVVFPLLILFTCYRSIITDRKNGTLKLLLCQGISMRQLIAGRVSAYTIVYWGFLFSTALLYAILFYLQGGEGGMDVLRLFSLFLLYGMYYLLLITFAVYFSARAIDPSGLLAALLAVWFVFTIIVPKSAANAGDHLAPLPTRMDLANAISEKKKLGLNGHDKKNPFTQRFIDSVLKAYKVDSAAQLPVKIGGLLMQADEDFNNWLYDEALGSVNRIIEKQNKIGSVAAFVDPFMAVKNLSMALAGTDMHHHFHFATDAEQYRRRMISTLNEQDAARLSQFKDEKGKLTKSFWDQLNDYKYSQPGPGWSLQHYRIELVALLCWVALAFFLVFFTSHKIKVA